VKDENFITKEEPVDFSKGHEDFKIVQYESSQGIEKPELLFDD